MKPFCSALFELFCILLLTLTDEKGISITNHYLRIPFAVKGVSQSMTFGNDNAIFLELYQKLEIDTLIGKSLLIIGASKTLGNNDIWASALGLKDSEITVGTN